MNTQTATNNKIKFIPTELNAFTYLKHKHTKQQKIIDSLCKWLVILLLWCTALTGYTVYEHIQQQKELINQTIINQEGIPLQQISIDEFEVIGD